MAMNNKGRSNRSLCEKSMMMVVNIVKLSSFSIAKMSLGAVGSPPATKGSVKVAANASLPRSSGSQRAQQPMIISKPVSYLIEPEEEKESSYVINKEKSVDGMASDYIRRVHEKNRQDFGEASRVSPYILPPPPHMLR